MKKTLREVASRLRAIQTPDLFVADAIQECIRLIEADLSPVPAPYQAHSETSRAAAASIQTNALERRVLELLARNPGGLTDLEGQALSGMSGSTYRPRRVSLLDKGLVTSTGNQKMTIAGRKALIWALTPRGEAAVTR